jgi:hypothetical protein
MEFNDVRLQYEQNAAEIDLAISTVMTSGRYVLGPAGLASRRADSSNPATKSVPMAIRNRFGFPDLGLGLGLRSVHYSTILEQHPPVDFFEILTENYLDTEGRPVWIVDQVAAHYPVVMHGVSLNLGTADPLDRAYLAKVKALAERVKARWLGDHVCFTGVAGKNSHDLCRCPTTRRR